MVLNSPNQRLSVSIFVEGGVFIQIPTWDGILLDSKLTFVPHIKGLKKKCIKALNLLRVVSSNDWGGDRIVLLRLYRALVCLKLDYGSP